MSKLASIKGYENQLVDMNKPNNLVFNVNGEDILILETNGDIRVKGNLIKNDIEVYYALVELLLRGGHSYKLKQAQERIKKLEEQIREQHKTVGILRENYNTACDEQDKEIREQLEAKILELEKQVEYYIQLKDFHLCDIKHLRAENKTIREQLIKELRRWIFMEYVPVFDRLVVDKDKLLAKLDLLEREI